MFKAFVLIALPLFCGAVLFWIEAPPQSPGVYVETRQGIQAVSAYRENVELTISGASKHPQVPGETVESLFIVGRDASEAAASAASVEVQFVLVDPENPDASPRYVSARVAVRRITPSVYQITSQRLDGWGAEGVAAEYFPDATHSEPLLRPDMSVSLAMRDSLTGDRHIYSVGLGRASAGR